MATPWRPDENELEEVLRVTPKSEWEQKSIFGYNMLTTALLAHRIDIASQLISAGFPIDKNNDGYVSSALSELVSIDDIDGIKFLLEHGASISGHEGEDETPLHRAVRIGAHSAAIELMNHGANPNHKDLGGRTCFDRVQFNDKRMLNILMQK